MATQTTKYKILIASPSDVVEERKVIPKVIENWNSTNSDYYGAILKPVLWEIDAIPEMGKRPQDIINEQLVNDCDILIGTFWTRLGTPTGKADSGTIEEIEEFLEKNKPVMLYFSSIPIDPKKIDIEQYKKLSDFRNECKENGLHTPYESIHQLEQKLQMHITKEINKIHQSPKKSVKYNEHFPSEALKQTQEYSQVISEEVDGNSLANKSVNTKEINPDIIAKITVLPRVYDDKIIPPIGSEKLPFYRWNALNFEEFWYDLKTGNTGETLEIGGGHRDFLTKPINHNNRIIPENTLIYLTKTQTKTLKLFESGFSSSDILNSFQNGQYYILGWQGQTYIAINGKANKLAKLIIEQGNAANEKKTLTIGETWDIGDGWTISVQSIDAKASPRQVWLVLGKDGVIKDDKVIAQGNSYIYIEKNFAGETDVPLFVTYVDSIFVGATTDMVQLRYTWAISTLITEPMVHDKFGNMEVITVESSNIILKNKNNSIDLTLDHDVDIMGNLKFKVADDPNFLRFHPMILK